MRPCQERRAHARLGDRYGVVRRRYAGAGAKRQDGADRGTGAANGTAVIVALAADDPFFASSGFGVIELWKAAKRPVELHLYEQGGHGFGMYPKPATSTGRFDAFVRWMDMHGWLKRAG